MPKCIINSFSKIFITILEVVKVWYEKKNCIFQFVPKIIIRSS